jgi:hypothetical protein
LIANKTKIKLFLSKKKLWLVRTLLKVSWGQHHCSLTVLQRQDYCTNKSNEMNITMVSLSVILALIEQKKQSVNISIGQKWENR